ncbi:hypothetical protein HPB49_002707 [Dermacentor silvarum]|uniref:Uncharacterized protein n=1 Tax=Dermacentor silvarum TaxID=543639 RepID=A0ACB8DA36_DERSI|nr:hypothetical protein HPB49_002707 [Dermacentor silvarum]
MSSRATTPEDLLSAAACVVDPFDTASEIRYNLGLNLSERLIRRRLEEAGLYSRISTQKPFLSARQPATPLVRRATSHLVGGRLQHSGVQRREHLLHTLGSATPSFAAYELSGWADLSYTGVAQIRTPNIDALAWNGVRLSRLYHQNLCTPSRAAIMTGRYPIHTGMQHLVILYGEPRGLPLNLKLLPEWLNELGYTSHMLGKSGLLPYVTPHYPIGGLHSMTPRDGPAALEKTA